MMHLTRLTGLVKPQRQPQRLRLAGWLQSLLVALSASLVLAACGFKPLYEAGGSSEIMQARLATVGVAPIKDRLGQVMHNALTARFGDTAQEDYRLIITLEETRRGFGLRSDASVSQEELTVRAYFTLLAVSDQARRDVAAANAGSARASQPAASPSEGEAEGTAADSYDDTDDDAFNSKYDGVPDIIDTRDTYIRRFDDDDDDNSPKGISDAHRTAQADGSILLTEVLVGRTSYDIVLSDFANVTQREDAAERLVLNLAGRIENRLALYFSSQVEAANR